MRSIAPTTLVIKNQEERWIHGRKGNPPFRLSQGHQGCGTRGLGRGWGREGTTGREPGQAHRKSNHGKRERGGRGGACKFLGPKFPEAWDISVSDPVGSSRRAALFPWEPIMGRSLPSRSWPAGRGGLKSRRGWVSHWQPRESLQRGGRGGPGA